MHYHIYIILGLLAAPVLAIGQRTSPTPSHADSNITTEISGPSLTVTQRASPISSHTDSGVTTEISGPNLTVTQWATLTDPRADSATFVPLAAIERQLVGLRDDMAQAKRHALDPTHFCYLDDKAYSQGAVVGHQECGPDFVGVNDASHPLRWTIH